MKVSLVILTLCIASTCSAQKTGFNRLVTDSVVRTIDASTTKTEKFRWLFGSYEFQTVNGNINKITHKEKAGPSQIIQVYYLANNKLIYAEENDNIYFEKDTSMWKGWYYFENNQLVDYVTLGHGKSETDEWNPEKDVLAAYNKAIARIKEYQKKKN